MPRRNGANKSLDASGGSVFRIMTCPAMPERIRAAALTQPFGCALESDIAMLQTFTTKCLRIFLIVLIPVNVCSQSLKVTLLGTGTPIPIVERFGPSILVEAGPEKLLFDCVVARRCACGNFTFHSAK